MQVRSQLTQLAPNRHIVQVIALKEGQENLDAAEDLLDDLVHHLPKEFINRKVKGRSKQFYYRDLVSLKITELAVTLTITYTGECWGDEDPEEKELWSVILRDEEAGVKRMVEFALVSYLIK